MSTKLQVLTIALLAVATLGSGIGVVYVQHHNRELFIQLQALQTERDRLEVEWEVLQLEQSTLMRNIAIEQKARTQLKMREPDPSEVLYITPP